MASTTSRSAVSTRTALPTATRPLPSSRSYGMNGAIVHSGRTPARREAMRWKKTSLRSTSVTRRRPVQPFRQPDARIAAADHHYVAVTHAESPVPLGGEGRGGWGADIDHSTVGERNA